MRHVIIFGLFYVYANNVQKYFVKKFNLFTNRHVFEGLFFDHRSPFVNEAILIRGCQGTSKPHITQQTKIQKISTFRKVHRYCSTVTSKVEIKISGKKRNSKVPVE